MIPDRSLSILDGAIVVMGWQSCTDKSSFSRAILDALAKEYDLDEIRNKISEVAEGLYLPEAESDGIISQFDGCKGLKEKDITYYKNLDSVFDIFKDYGFEEIMQK